MILHNKLIIAFLKKHKDIGNFSDILKLLPQNLNLQQNLDPAKEVLKRCESHGTLYFHKYTKSSAFSVHAPINEESGKNTYVGVLNPNMPYAVNLHKFFLEDFKDYIDTSDYTYILQNPMEFVCVCKKNTLNYINDKYYK